MGDDAFGGFWTLLVIGLIIWAIWGGNGGPEENLQSEVEGIYTEDENTQPQGSDNWGNLGDPLERDDPYTTRPFSSGDYDCEDFGSQDEAQDFFEDEGGPYDDPHNLDRDGDGIACEALR
jgi:hypothetical protein